MAVLPSDIVQGNTIPVAVEYQVSPRFFDHYARGLST